MAFSKSRNLSLCVSRPSFSGSNENQNSSTVLVESKVPETSQDNHVLIRVDRFGFSANNITYQALGEAPHFRYFDFHDVPETNRTSQKSHGLIPVWGFGTVVWTSHKRIEVGERVYGYLATTRYLLLPISPSDVNKYAFFVSRPQFPRDRRPYNQITRCRSDPQYNPLPEIEDLTMLYRPPYWTSFWCEDWLTASKFRGGASRFIISSASSKTAFCLAYLIRSRFRKNGELSSLNIVGLTSKKNAGFTRSLGLYDTIVKYGGIQGLFEAIASDIRSTKWIYIDVAGNEPLNEKLRAFFSLASNATLAAHISLGLTNPSPTPTAPIAASTSWSESTKLFEITKPALSSTGSSMSANASQSIPDPESFFMPEWLAVRRTQLSIAQITTMQADAWAALLRDGRSWVQIERIFGGTKVINAYEWAVHDGLGPEKGYIWSLWEEDEAERTVTVKL